MLSDVFVPLLTYPDPTPIDVAKTLPGYLSRFARTVTFCSIEVDVPDLANRWGAALIALPQMIDKVEADSRQAAKALQQATSATLQSLRISHQMVRCVFGQLGPALLPTAQNHDICLVPINPGSSEKSALAEAFIFGTGRPVMVTPEQDLTSFDIGNVVIGWDGGRHASRAVFDSMPILVAAEKVTILTAPGDKPIAETSVRQLTAYLERHGVKPEVNEIDVKASDAGDALQGAAAQTGAGLLVMGAYGHSRLREFVLGGATRTVLNAPILPILLSH